METGNQATVAWGLGIGYGDWGIRLLWYGDWEPGYCGMGAGNQATIVGIRLPLWEPAAIILLISSG